MLSYLLEIGCEEIPAGVIEPTYTHLKSEFEKQLQAENIEFASIISGGTPRRLYVSIEGIATHQANKSEIIMGPPAKIAFNEDGSLTPVAIKFAESKGLDVATLTKASTPKGDYLQGEKTSGGTPSKDILARVVPDIIRNIPLPKSMKWGDNEFRFSRPIHSFVSVLDGEVLPFEIDGIKAGKITFGHRFLSPTTFEVANFEEYKQKLADAKVIIDSEERKALISKQIIAFNESENIQIIADEGLLNTVANLVEYPHSVVGSFSEDFLVLPQEVLITSMKVHQKYFPVMDKAGKLINKFVGVSNTVPTTNDDLIRQGYERVLKARLNDGLFFFNNDKNNSLDNMVEKLKKVVYQEKLGTSYEKVERFTVVARWLADKYAPNTCENVLTTAKYAKADLMSEMVYEFPELQGIMGMYYATYANLDKNIALGINEHYMPRFAGDVLPTTWEGRLVSIADKIDTIAGAFAAGMIPTGNFDPYGLRRSAIGILSIIEQADMRIDISELVTTALNNFINKLTFDFDDTKQKITSFIMLRLKQMVVSKGIADGETFDAIADKTYDAIALNTLAGVLTQSKGTDEFMLIASSYKRINNILKKIDHTDINYNERLFQCDEERAVSNIIKSQNIGTLMEAEQYSDALVELMKFAPAVEAFFANVMVMADDVDVKQNRLNLIASLRAIFKTVCDFEAI